MATENNYTRRHNVKNNKKNEMLSHQLTCFPKINKKVKKQKIENK